MKKLITSFFIFTFTGFTAVALAGNNECFECHQELTNIVKHKAAQISCELCHVNHDGTALFPYRMKKPVNEICQTCHKTQQVRHQPAQHPNNFMIGGSNSKAPGNFTCVTCHNPHQSKMPKLIRHDYERSDSPYRGQMCTICHGAIVGIPDNVPMPRGDVYGNPED